MRKRLATLVAATTSLVLLAFLVPLAWLLRSEAAERATTAATLTAQSVGQQLPDLAEGSLPTSSRVTVFLPDGRVLGLPADRTPAVDLAARGQSFVAEAPGGRQVLISVLSLTAQPAVVRVFVPNSELYAGVVRTWTLLALLGTILFVLGMMLADRLGRRLVGSITALAGTADRLGRGESGARVEPDGPPEVQHVGQELNRLADRIDELLVATRAETADLAHRLRTPLTALRLDIGGLRDPAESSRLGASLDDLSAEVDELIRTARRPVRDGSGAGSDLAAVARERLHFWSALAEDTGRPLTGELPERPVPVRAGSDDLAAAFDVLLDNAFRHTPGSTAVRMVVTVSPFSAAASVEDDGPGFGGSPATEAGTTRSAGSTGLGLDIARRTAVAAGGRLELGRSGSGGAKAVLVLPLLSPAGSTGAAGEHDDRRDQG
ncbi:HAMP domain-containing sensor histidine kinase [Kribbella deserti]|uniref:histidine kinase n=1 Tax=Kribbella deserti TaxID=1926257 RepID=A0ABV6QD23_9ACTN